MAEHNEGPLQLRCHKCGHKWIVCQLPIEITKLVRMLKGALCPACNADDPGMLQPRREAT